MAGTLTRNIGINVGSGVVPLLVGLGVAPILARALGAEGRGELAAIMAPVTIFSIVCAFGLPESVTFHVAQGIGFRPSVWTRAVATLLVSGMAGAGLALWYYQRVDATLVFVTLAVPAGLLGGLARGYAAGRQRWGLVAVERVTGALCRLGGLVVLFFAGGLNVGSASLVMVFSPVVGCLVYLAVLLDRRPRSILSRDRDYRPLAAYGLGIWPGALASILIQRLDQMLMAPLAGNAQLGIYAVAVTVSEVALIFMASVREILFAAESATIHDERLAEAARVSTIITLIICLALFAMSVILVPYFFGPAFLEAVPSIGLLLIAMVVGNPGAMAGVGLGARGKPILQSLSLLAGLAVGTLSLVLLAPMWGAIGASLATIIGNAVVGNLNIMWLKRRFSFDFEMFYAWRPADFRRLVNLGKSRVALLFTRS